MDINGHWERIRKVFRDAFRSSLHYAVATVNEDGTPHITPIGSIVLQDGNRGFYCEEYPRKLPRNLKVNQRVCILAVNSSKWYWVKSLFLGKFSSPPGVRLMGRAGERRKATDEEMGAWLRRIRPLRWFKGYDLLWSNMHYIREITFDAFEPIQSGKMTKDLWLDI
jgi:hypothetical protein